jgi:hypothetical protein
MTDHLFASVAALDPAIPALEAQRDTLWRLAQDANSEDMIWLEVAYQTSVIRLNKQIIELARRAMMRRYGR